MSISDRLDEITARCDAATEGSWESDRHVRGDGHVVIGGGLRRAHLPGDVPGHAGNAEFIAHARTDVPALVAALSAVLDRHKPHPDEGMGWRDDNTYGDVGTVCNACGTPDEYGVPWPCPTVLAIEKALQ